VAAADARRLHPPRRGEVGGAEAHALHARRRGGDLLDVGDAQRGLEDRVDEDRPLQPVPRLELREEPVDVVDVPRALDLRNHDHVEPVADLAHQRDEVVEHPWRVERVHPRPQRRAAEVDLPADPHQSGARGLLAVGRHRVIEVAEQDVGRGRDAGQLGGHLLVRGVEEVDHPRRRDGDLGQRIRRALRERLGEVSGIAHTGAPYRRSCQHGAV
jgi:hypothetical protein